MSHHPHRGLCDVALNKDMYQHQIIKFTYGTFNPSSMTGTSTLRFTYGTSNPPLVTGNFNPQNKNKNKKNVKSKRDFRPKDFQP